MFRLKLFVIIFFSILRFHFIGSSQKAKDNGDTYIVQESLFIKDIPQKMLTESALLEDHNNFKSSTSGSVPKNADLINFDELISKCNSSFYIPMHYYTAFNTTAELPDLVDKTGMCFIRCLYEKSGLIENWKLNAEKIRANIWPVTADAIEACQKEEAKEKNACVRTYAIAKCLTLQSLKYAANQGV